MRTPIRTRTDVTAALLMHRPMLSAVEAAVKSGAVDYTISRDENNVLGYITTAHGRMYFFKLSRKGPSDEWRCIITGKDIRELTHEPEDAE